MFQCLKTSSGNRYFYNSINNRIETTCTNFSKTSAISLSADLKPSVINLKGKLTHLCIELTRDCNLRCKYCCYNGTHSHRRTHQKKAISRDTLSSALDFFKSHRKFTQPSIISFYGGEPLLEFEKVKYTVCKAKQELNGCKFLITTNGTLISNQFIDWFAREPDVSVNISIDGPQHYHDEQRIFADGCGSFETITANIWPLIKSSPAQASNRINFVTTVQKVSDLISLNEAWERHDLLSKFVPVSVGVAHNGKTCTDLSENQIKDFVDCYSRNKRSSLIHRYMADRLYAIKNREYSELPVTIQTSGLCIPNTNRIFVDVTGHIGVCEKTSDNMRFGDVDNGVSEIAIRNILQEYIDLRNRHCSTCWAIRLCTVCLLHSSDDDQTFKEKCESRKQSIRHSLQLFCEIAERNCLI
jgi:uncharacterized protein